MARFPLEIERYESMTRDPCTVEPVEPIPHVAREAARRRFGSAVVAQGGRPRGVLTSTDALVALTALLESERALGAGHAERLRTSPQRPAHSAGWAEGDSRADPLQEMGMPSNHPGIQEKAP
jgi:hypothetical protein